MKREVNKDVTLFLAIQLADGYVRREMEWGKVRRKTAVSHRLGDFMRRLWRDWYI